MTKVQNYFRMIAAMALSIAAISCNKIDGPAEPDSVISLNGVKNVVTVKSEVSLLEIPYSVTGKSAGAEVNAAFDSDWLSIAAEENAENAENADGSPHTLRVAVAENKSGSSRTGKITLSLSGAKNVILAVIQGANPDYKIVKTMTFALNVTDVESSSAHIEVSPLPSDTYYYYGVVPAATYEAFSTGADFVADYVGQIKSYVEKQSASYGREMSLVELGLVNKGFKSLTYNGFSPETEYCLVAFDLTLGCESSGNVAVKKFKTTRTPASSTDFEISIDSKTATVTVTPASTTTGNYVVDVYSVSFWEKFTTPKAVAEEWLTWVSESDSYSISSFLYTAPEEAVRQYYKASAQSGNISTGDYVAFAFGVNDAGDKVTTGVSYQKFHFDAPSD